MCYGHVPVCVCVSACVSEPAPYVTPSLPHNTHTQEDDTCCFDWGLLVEPVTLLCGHTFCRRCVEIMLDDAAAKVCGGGINEEKGGKGPWLLFVDVVLIG